MTIRPAHALFLHRPERRHPVSNTADLPDQFVSRPFSDRHEHPVCRDSDHHGQIHQHKRFAAHHWPGLILLTFSTYLALAVYYFANRRVRGSRGNHNAALQFFSTRPLASLGAHPIGLGGPGPFLGLLLVSASRLVASLSQVWANSSHRSLASRDWALAASSRQSFALSLHSLGSPGM